jgi:hypothetical protein
MNGHAPVPTDCHAIALHRSYLETNEWELRYKNTQEHTFKTNLKQYTGSGTVSSTIRKLRFNLRCTHISSPYRAVNTLRIGYKNQSVNAV